MILVNSPTKTVDSTASVISVNSKKFINNRYRVGTYLLSTSTPVLDAEAPFDPRILEDFNATKDTLMSITAVYSPPGFVATMGNLEIDSGSEVLSSESAGYVANVLGYMEVFGNASIKSDVFKSLGLVNQAIDRTTGDYTLTIPSYGRVAGSNTEAVLQNPQELDSLFHVSGFLATETSQDWYEKINSFDYFVHEAALQLSDELSGNGGDAYYRDTDPYEESGWTIFTSNADSLSISPNIAAFKEDPTKQLVVDWEIDVDVTYRNGGGVLVNKSNNYTYQKTGSSSFSFTEIMTDYYGVVKGKLVALYEEFNWWGN